MNGVCVLCVCAWEREGSRRYTYAGHFSKNCTFGGASKGGLNSRMIKPPKKKSLTLLTRDLTDLAAQLALFLSLITFWCSKASRLMN
jgi:hypothetical protein